MPNHVTEWEAAQFQDTEHAAGVRKVTWAGLAANVFLAVLKFVAGTIGGSQAVVADGVHSLSDSSTDIAILIGVRYWTQPPDETHPHGHRRIETAITVFIGAALAAVAVGLVYNALSTLHKQNLTPPGWTAFYAAIASIVCKEVLFRWTVAVGKRTGSAAVIANAWHHRSDALSSLPAAVAVAGAAISPAWAFLDHIGAIVVSLFIIQAAWNIGWPAMQQLVDTGASRRERAEIHRIALGTEGVREVHGLRTRHIGSGLQVDLHILVDGSISVRDGHDISTKVKRNLIENGPEVVDVVVHLEPYE